MKLAYVCYLDKGTYDSPVENEEKILLEFLQEKGLDIERVIWDDLTINWQSFDLAILKSPWDYFDKIEAFYAWLDMLKEIGLPLQNPVDVVKWNADKHYLKDIADGGLKVVPTEFLEKNSTVDLNGYFEHFNAAQFIIKPAVSGGSKNTFRVDRANIDEISDTIKALLPQEAFMVQPFLKEIETEGELSFLFFNGKFSHALLKKARSGDFRVQHYLGGTIYPQQPAQEMLATASAYVEQFAKDCLYARVDGVMVNGQFHLMELELIEPFLFLFTDPAGYENYYEALKERIELGRGG